MLYPAIYILILIFLFIILTMIRINILIEYLKDGYDDNFVISIFILNSKLKLKYEIPIIDIEKNGIKFVKFKKTGKNEKEKDKETKKFSFNTIYERIKYFKHIYERNRSLISKIMLLFKKRLIIKEIKCDLEFGTGIPFYTGIFGGVIWSVFGVIISYIESNYKTNKKSINIKNNFKDVRFKIDFYCIFTIKIVHIIVIGAKLLTNFLRHRKNITSYKFRFEPYSTAPGYAKKVK